MAVVAAQTIDWTTPTNFPQGQTVSFATASMEVQPVLMINVVAAPEPYGTIAPAPPPPSFFSFG